jgi:superfamily II DNA or RNA helicase
MGKLKLRDYQKKDYKEFKELLKKNDHVIYGASVGYGKSIIAHKITKDAVKKDKRVLVLLPRRKLVKQIKETLSEFIPSVIMGSDTIYFPDAEVYVASIQTLNSRIKKYGKKYLGDIDVVIQDECHQFHMTASTQSIRDLYWDNSKWIGMSGTPIDDRGYRLEGYDHTLYNHQMQDLIDMGMLTPVKVMVEETPDGLEDVDLVGGDYNEGQLFDLMGSEQQVNNVYQIWKKYAKERKTMVFAVNIAHAELILEDFIKHGVSAGISHSNLDEEFDELTLEQFRFGEINVLINVSKLTTGYDEPSIDCLIMARPSKSKRLVIQMYGRSLRLYPDKKESLILDLAGIVKQHGYPTARYDFNKVRPPAGSSMPIEFKELTCPICDYSTQRRHCKKQTITTKLLITKRLICPNCEAVIDETIEDTKEIERLILVKDISNVSKVSDKQVGKWVEKLRKHAGYKEGWTNYVAKAYNKSEHIEEQLKVLYNKYKAEMIKEETAIKHIKKLIS